MNSPDVIYCLQTVSMNKTYLLPSVCVREIVPFTPLDQAKHNDYLVGHCRWRDQVLPIIDLSLTACPIDITPLTHIMVLHCPQPSGMGLVGTLISQIPRSVTVHPNDLSFHGQPEGHLYEVRGVHLDAVIVDLTKLGARLKPDEALHSQPQT